MTNDLIEVNVAGRLMLLLTKHGLLDNRCLSIYQRAVGDAVRLQVAQRPGDGGTGIDTILDEQLTLLESALSTRRYSAVVDRDAAPRAPSESTDAGSAVADARQASAPKSSSRESKPASGYVPAPKSMEEKLKDARKPIQTLLKEDCVRIGLIDAKKADKLILGMTGKTSEQAELDIVEHLRRVLQDQVKSFIRKAKGGPWADPRTQEDLRKDIHAARNVRSILMMARQVVKEYQTWEKENRRVGILGLFGPRRRIVQRS